MDVWIACKADQRIQLSMLKRYKHQPYLLGYLIRMLEGTFYNHICFPDELRVKMRYCELRDAKISKSFQIVCPFVFRTILNLVLATIEICKIRVRLDSIAKISLPQANVSKIAVLIINADF